MIEFPDITEHGWGSNGNVIWTTSDFPDSIVELLVYTEDEIEDDTIYFSEDEIDDDD